MALKHTLGPAPHLTMESKDPNGHTLFERSGQLIAEQIISQLFSTQVPIKNQAPDSIDQMPVADQLNNCTNLSEVISSLRSINLGKALCSSGIPPGIL